MVVLKQSMLPAVKDAGAELVELGGDRFFLIGSEIEGLAEGFENLGAEGVGWCGRGQRRWILRGKSSEAEATAEDGEECGGDEEGVAEGMFHREVGVGNSGSGRGRNC